MVAVHQISTKGEQPGRILDLTSSSPLDNPGGGIQDPLQHGLGKAVDDAVALDPADAVAEVVQDLATHGWMVDPVL